MEILEHNFNRHFDGIANKVFRSYFIKYQIELLNKNGHDIRVVFKMEADPYGFFEEQNYYDYFNKTHDFELTIDEVGDIQLNTLESYGIYDKIQHFQKTLENPEMDDPIASKYMKEDLFLKWVGDLINSTYAYNSKFYNLAEEIYNNFDKPEWCIHIRNTDKYDRAAPIPIDIIYNRIEELDIGKTPFFVMTDSNETLNELISKYKNIRYFKNHLRSNDILPIHCMWGIRKLLDPSGKFVPKSEQEKQVILEILVQLLCDKLLYTISSGPISMWSHLFRSGYKNPPIEIWSESMGISLFPSVESVKNYYQEKIRKLFGILYDLDTLIRKRKVK